MKKKIVCSMLLCATLVQADFIGGEVDLAYLSEQPSGDFSYKGSTADVENTFGWDRENNFFIKGYIKHPVPVLPNIRVAYTNLSHAGSGTVTNFTYDDKTYSGTISTKFDADIIDGTLYYEILDNWINLDIGLNAKYIKTTASVENQLIGKSSADVSVVIPTVYAKARLDIPNTDLSFQAEGDMISYSGNTLYDVYLGTRYTFVLGLGLEAGMKIMKLKLDDVDDVTADVDFTGVYAAIVWDF